ncbi:Fc.00g068120.m01.CDS01 [Cosmosporella sp. VM-42]
MANQLYTPIGCNDIRLFSIQDGQRDEQLRLKLSVFQPRRCPLYVALSYVWGGEPAKHEIIVNGEPFAIRPNLYRLLVQLRESQPNTLFWTDAISINQRDESEKAEQVGRMGQVYSDASHTIAWVFSSGAVVEGVQAANEFVQTLADFLTSPRWQGRSGAGLLSLMSGQEDLTEQERAALKFLIRVFLVPAYWGRRWVVQELVLSKAVTLMLGGVTIPLDAISRFLGSTGIPTPTSPGTLVPLMLVLPLLSGNPQNPEMHDLLKLQEAPVVRICEHRAEMRLPETDGRMTLMAVLKRYHTWECSSEGDIFYSLRGLTLEKEQLNVNYSTPFVELVTQALEIMAKSDKKHIGHLPMMAALLLRQTKLDRPALISKYLLKPSFSSLEITLPLRVRGYVSKLLTEACVEKEVGLDLVRHYFDTHEKAARKANRWYGERKGYYDLPADEQARKTFMDLARRGFWNDARTPEFWERQVRPDGDGLLEVESGSFWPKKREASWSDVSCPRFFAGQSASLLSSAFGTLFGPQIELVGIAEFPIEKGDEIWQFPGVDAAYIARATATGYRIISAARIGRLNDIDESQDPITSKDCNWSCLKVGSSVGRSRTMRPDIPFLLELSRCAAQDIFS